MYIKPFSFKWQWALHSETYGVFKQTIIQKFTGWCLQCFILACQWQQNVKVKKKKSQSQLKIKVKHQCQLAKDQASMWKSAKGQTTKIKVQHTCKGQLEIKVQHQCQGEIKIKGEGHIQDWIGIKTNSLAIRNWM